ncbi:MAG TPA: hypothetical protein VHP62_06400 [Usitatibacter sp.]|jgi:hypothetical protein|nr:hypothetical protein [Usitatibacter sp.]
MRSLAPVLAIAVSIVLGLALVYLYMDDRIGVATVMAACFALGAVIATALLLHGGDEQETDPGPWLHL